MTPKLSSLLLRSLFCTAVLMACSSVALAQQPAAAANGIPEVALSDQHAEMCKVKVGDAFPEASLPLADGSGEGTLESQRGRIATVVAVWRGEGRMSRTLLRDLHYDVEATYALADASGNKQPGISTVAVANQMSGDQANEVARGVGYQGTVLVDEQGELFSKIGTDRLPRVYVLDQEGKVVWMDLEYSQATRRELRQTLRVLLARGNASPQ